MGQRPRRLTCSACKTEKDLSEFWPSLVARGRKRCIDCIRIERQRASNTDHRAFLRRAAGNLRRKRAKSAYVWDITDEDLLTLWDAQQGRCAVSGLHMTHHTLGSRLQMNASIDRINNLEGYTKLNVQLVCAAVNMMRGSLNVDEFDWWIRTIYEHQRQR